MTNTIDDLKALVEVEQEEVRHLKFQADYYERLLCAARQCLASREKALQAAVERQSIEEGK